jgi:hypothetical protein
MQLQPEQLRDLARELELQVEVRAKAAKLAIREYKKSIRQDPSDGGIRRTEGQRKLERVVGEYIQSRRRLDEIRAEISAHEK